jgi:hypothetical protein
MSGAFPSERGTVLLARCLEAGDRIAPMLTVGDREALLLNLRLLTLGDTINAVLRCPAASCGEPMDLSLAVSTLLLPPYLDSRATYDITVDVDGRACEATFRLPTAADLDCAAPLARTDPDRAATGILRRCVLRARAGGVTVQPDDLPVAAQDAISEAMAEYDPQAELNLDLCCPACGFSFSALFDAAAFFLNELEQLGAQLLADVHTLALHYHWSEAEIRRMPVSRRKKYLAMLAHAGPVRRLQ